MPPRHGATGSPALGHQKRDNTSDSTGRAVKFIAFGLKNPSILAFKAKRRFSPAGLRMIQFLLDTLFYDAIYNLTPITSRFNSPGENHMATITKKELIDRIAIRRAIGACRSSAGSAISR